MDDYPQENRDPLNEYTSMMKATNPCDSDAGYMNRSGKPKGFHYLAHQCSDADTGIIVDVEVTAGDVQDCECCVFGVCFIKPGFRQKATVPEQKIAEIAKYGAHAIKARIIIEK